MPDASFRLIVAGGRDFADYLIAWPALDKTVIEIGQPIEIVSGMAPGADQLGCKYAKHKKLKLHEYPANWAGLGLKAGFMRNSEMAKVGDGLVCFWDGKSNGSKDMLQQMRRLNKPVFIYRY